MDQLNQSTPSPATTPFPYLRPGLTPITPYLVVQGAAETIGFLSAAFGAAERLRVPSADGKIMHAEVTIGNGSVELADASDIFPAAPTDIHLYVPDCDATYNQAIAAGATALEQVQNQPWGDRQGSVRDPFGNNWYIATAGYTPGPEGIPSIQPFLHLLGAQRMIAFAESAFHAEALGVAKSDDGLILHATMRIGNATFEINEAYEQFQPKPCHLHIYVPDTDAAYASALRAGATSMGAPKDEPYGDRSAGIKDIFGNSWFIATWLGN